MPHEPLHSLGFAAVGGNQVGEVRMPAHASDIATHAGQLRFIFKADVRADLERLILQRPLVRIVDVHGRCGLAELAPRGPHRVGDLVEVDVILFAVVRHHVGVLVKPAGDGDDVLGQQRLLLQEPVVVEAVLPVQRDDAVEVHRHHVEHDGHVRRRPTGADEHLHPAILQLVQRVDGGLRDHMRHETRQRAVDVEERRLDVGSHGGRRASGARCHDVVRCHVRNLRDTKFGHPQCMNSAGWHSVTRYQTRPATAAVAAVWWALSTNQSGNEHDSSNTTGGLSRQ